MLRPFLRGRYVVLRELSLRLESTKTVSFLRTLEECVRVPVVVVEKCHMLPWHFSIRRRPFGSTISPMNASPMSTNCVPNIGRGSLRPVGGVSTIVVGPKCCRSCTVSPVSANCGLHAPFVADPIFGRRGICCLGGGLRLSPSTASDGNFVIRLRRG